MVKHKRPPDWQSDGSIRVNSDVCWEGETRMEAEQFEKAWRIAVKKMILF